jgi:hypothetical protein
VNWDGCEAGVGRLRQLSWLVAWPMVLAPTLICSELFFFTVMVFDKVSGFIKEVKTFHNSIFLPPFSTEYRIGIENKEFFSKC